MWASAPGPWRSGAKLKTLIGRDPHLVRLWGSATLLWEPDSARMRKVWVAGYDRSVGVHTRAMHVEMGTKKSQRRYEVAKPANSRTSEG